MGKQEWVFQKTGTLDQKDRNSTGVVFAVEHPFGGQIGLNKKQIFFTGKRVK